MKSLKLTLNHYENGRTSIRGKFLHGTLGVKIYAYTHTHTHNTWCYTLHAVPAMITIRGAKIAAKYAKIRGPTY